MKAELLEFYSSRKEFLAGLELANIDIATVFDKEYDFSPSPVMLIGEAPGETEAREGRPFCGMAGKNLAKLIESSGINRKKLLITNAFAFRTLEPTKSGAKNRTPNNEELKLGAKMLSKELSIVRPKILILLGGSAEKAFLKIEDKTLREAFKALNKHEIKEIAHNGGTLWIAKTHHPSPLVFNRPDKRAELYEFFARLNELAR